MPGLLRFYCCRVITGLLLLSPLGVRAQASVTQVADSLRALLAQPGLVDSMRVEYLAEISGQLSMTDVAAARRYAQQSLVLARRIGYHRGEAVALNNLAAMAYYASDYSTAQQTFEAALQASRRAHLPNQIANAWLGLGNVAQALNNLPTALHDFEQARVAFSQVQFPAQAINGQLLVLNNSGNAYLQLHQPVAASKAFRQALTLAGPQSQPRLVASLLGNLAGLQDQAGHYDSALVNLKKGLQIARQTGDLAGESAIQTELAQNALLSHHPEQARNYATRAIALARQTGDSYGEEESLHMLAAALHALHLPGAFDTLQAYLTLHDTLLTQDRVNAIIEAQTRFDVATKQARIRELEQQRQIQQLETERRQARTLLLVGTLVVLLLLTGGGLVWYYRRRQIQHEAALRARLAADLHDDVGSLLTQLTIQSGLLSANAPTNQQRTRLNQLADTSRRAALHLIDVVWRLDTTNDTLGHLLDRCREHAYDVLGTADISLSFQVDAHLDRSMPLTPDVRQHLYLIFKEALHNVVKHAGAANVRIRFAPNGGKGLLLLIEDDGPGNRPGGTVGLSSGRGLTNMQARAKAIGGQLSLGQEAAGFHVRLVVP